jgi:hypothetical protein
MSSERGRSLILATIVWRIWQLDGNMEGKDSFLTLLQPRQVVDFLAHEFCRSLVGSIALILCKHSSP